VTRASRTVWILSTLVAIGCGRPFIPPPQVPDNLRVTNGHVVLEAHGEGVQIYACKAKADDPSKFEWTFVEPETDLMNDQGEKIGKHHGGLTFELQGRKSKCTMRVPTWELNDGSKVTGDVEQKADALFRGYWSEGDSYPTVNASLLMQQAPLPILCKSSA
jgi:hypothetical protein